MIVLGVGSTADFRSNSSSVPPQGPENRNIDSFVSWFELGWVCYISVSCWPFEVKDQIVALDLEYPAVSRHGFEKRKTQVFDWFVFGSREMEGRICG